MIRTQIQLTEEQSRKVKEVAQREDISMAEVIRRAVDHWIATYGDMSRAERKRRALSAMGRFSSGVGDLAENHDSYLAEAYGDYEPRDDLP